MKKVVLGLMALAITVASVAQNNGKKGNNGHKAHKSHKEVKHQDKHEDRDQDHRDHEKNRDYKNDNLSAAQQNQHKIINENFRNSMKNLQQDITLSKEVKQQRKQVLIAEHKAQIHATLTPEQRSQWEMKKDKRGNNGRDRNNG